jgi:Pilus formation protein N terminal region
MRLDRTLRRLPALAASCVMSLLAASTAHGAQKAITVNADQAKIISIAGRPATVVVGNPMIADVTIQGEVLAVHGRHFGNTNVIILDNQGGELAVMEVNVIRSGTQHVEMFKGGNEGKIVGRFSYVCAPDCESVLMPGDDIDYNTGIVAEVTAKSKEALTSAQASGGQ